MWEAVEEQGAAVILVGHFNPSIFNPDWLVRRDIVSVKEVEGAEVEIIHPEIARFAVPGLKFEIISERFTLNALYEPFVRLADIVAETFSVALPHTPLDALGINYFAHFRVRDFAQQKAFGRALAPTQPWGAWGELMEGKKIEDVGGLVSLTMQQSALPDRHSGYVTTTVQPSTRIEKGQGVFVQVNDHFDRGEDTAKLDFASICVDEFTGSIERSKRIIKSMIDLARTL